MTSYSLSFHDLLNKSKELVEIKQVEQVSDGYKPRFGK